MNDARIQIQRQTAKYFARHQTTCTIDVHKHDTCTATSMCKLKVTSRRRKK